jgi:hypothetical protein
VGRLVSCDLGDDVEVIIGKMVVPGMDVRVEFGKFVAVMVGAVDGARMTVGG